MSCLLHQLGAPSGSGSVSSYCMTTYRWNCFLLSSWKNTFATVNVPLTLAKRNQPHKHSCLLSSTGQYHCVFALLKLSPKHKEPISAKQNSVKCVCVQQTNRKSPAQSRWTQSEHSAWHRLLIKLSILNIPTTSKAAIHSQSHYYFRFSKRGYIIFH